MRIQRDCKVNYPQAMRIKAIIDRIEPDNSEVIKKVEDIGRYLSGEKFSRQGEILAGLEEVLSLLKGEQ